MSWQGDIESRARALEDRAAAAFNRVRAAIVELGQGDERDVKAGESYLSAVKSLDASHANLLRRAADAAAEGRFSDAMHVLEQDEVLVSQYESLAVAAEASVMEMGKPSQSSPAPFSRGRNVPPPPARGQEGPCVGRRGGRALLVVVVSVVIAIWLWG